MDTEDFSAARLADFIVGLSFADLPFDLTGQARRCLVDAVGCLVAAHRTEPGEAIRRLAQASDERGDIRIPGSDLRTTAGFAAFVNAQLINALDFDDIYTKGHPGATVNAAAISVGQAVACSNHELLTAIVAGYETSCRVAISLVQTAPRKFVHGHGTWQVFGAAAAAAKLMKLDRTQTAYALAIAATNAPLASVMKTVYGERPSSAKNNFGTAAWVGVNAARMAQAGFDGPLDAFDGETGFWRMFGADGFDRNALLDGLGERYEMLKVGFKTYSTCRIVQSSIEAAIGAAQASGIDVTSDDLDAITITGSEILSRPPFAVTQPEDMWAAQFSVPYAVAAALSDIPPGPNWFTDSTLRDPRLRRLASKVTIRPHPSQYTAKGHFHAATAEVRTRDGRTFADTVEIARGEYLAPLSDDEVVEKANRLLGDEAGLAKRLVETPLETCVDRFLVD